MHDVLHLTLGGLLVLLPAGCAENPSTGPGSNGGCDDGPICCDDTFSYLGYGESDTEARWTPDGETIVYCHSGMTELGDTTGIYFITAQGTENRLFLQGLSSSPTWSPDGEWLVFSQNAGLYKVRVDGKDLAEIAALPAERRWPDWSPDGSKIAYCSTYGEERGIWVVPADGQYSSECRRLIYPGLYPRWSHSGQQIVFRGYLAEGTGICVMDSSGVNPRCLFSKEYCTLRHPTFSPDDSRVAFQCSEPGHVPQIWVMNADGSNPRQLTTCGGAYPEWSPDGKYIAYTDTRRCNGRLWIMKPDGTCKRQLTHAEWWSRNEG